MKTVRMDLVILCITLFFVLFVSSCGNRTAAVSGATALVGGQTRDTLATDSLTVSSGTLVSVISAAGLVSGVQEAVVVAEAQGIINTISFAIGDRVREGQALVTLENSIAALNVQRAKDQLDSAVLELRATEQLAASGGASQAALTRSRGAVSTAKAQYQSVLKAFNDTTVRSPITGLVASRENSITLGGLLPAWSRVARIVDNSSFKITIGVGEREIGLIETGSPVTISIPAALGDQTISGTVQAVGAGSDPATGSFPVVIVFPNRWGNLVKSGMSATVQIASRQATPAVIVPTSALLRRGGRYAAFVAIDGTARVRELTLGRRSGVRVEVLSGLEDGEELIVSTLARLQNGTPVTTTNRGASADRE